MNDRHSSVSPAVDPIPGIPGPHVVGIGASAGGLAALRAFFARVPESSGLAYVVIVHLSPEHPSHLAELLQPHVRIPVQQVTETTPLQADCVYVIPPNAHLSTIDTHLRLSNLEEERRNRAPIDHFFRTLASTHQGRAVGVILSGTGSDGALGIKAIKENGGLTIVQDPGEAEYDGMPQNAIATGLVDLVLPLEGIAAAAMRFAHTEPRVPVADEDELEWDDGQLLQKCFGQLRAHTGRDFSYYKRSTILRRFQRRMQIRQVEELRTYLEVLRREPEEVRALADDILITVTNFFRDPEIFALLEREIIPRLFDGKAADDNLRVWSVGCATGEEAYSLAILLLEEASRREIRPRIQVFASDLHEMSLVRAREGFYPGDIAVDVSEDRLRRHFHKEDGGYRVRKELRELIVFAPHNLLGDPPFSRLDLITCRNVLIYLQRDAQQNVLELLHYALRPEGYLILGTSETVENSGLFRPEQQRQCVFRRRNGPSLDPRLPLFARAGHMSPGRPSTSDRPTEPSHGALHQRMVERYAPPSIVVNPDDVVIHLSEHAGRYLLQPGGDATLHVFKLVRPELRIELRGALHEARKQGKARRSRPVVVRIDGEDRLVVLDVRSTMEPEETGYALVIFYEHESPDETPPAGMEAAQAPGDGARERELEAELALAQQRLQAIIEEYETTQEELRASNEELMSANEELRSTLEELETSKEELQSMNEELQTVNQENRHKVEEFAQLSSDLQNLLASTEIAALFLDGDMRILRFTPRAAELFNIRPADRGRPLSDLTNRLHYQELTSDARTVLRTLVAQETEVEDESGRWYLARVLPYRSHEDRVGGVVITLVDITERKRSELAMREAMEAAEKANHIKTDFLAVMSHELRTPLTGIIGYTDLLTTEVFGPVNEQQRASLARVETCSWHLVSIIDEILTLSRVEAGRDEARPEQADLTTIVREVVDILTPAAEAKGLSVRIEGVEHSLAVLTDPGKVRQVLLNLIGNAVRYTTRGEVVITVEEAPDALQVHVRDTGPGIKPEDQERIFEAFTQLDNAYTRTHPGIGLGLAISRKLAGLLGGAIFVRSIPGEGSTFSLRMPREAVEA